MLSFHTNHRLLLVVPVTVFAVLSVMIAIVPAMQQNVKYAVAEGAKPPTDDVLRGRAIYQREACTYCHTQQVREDNRQPMGADGRFPPLAQDTRYGRPSRSEDYAADDPPFLGTQRTGPDLQDIGTRLPSAEWHYTHLFDPRVVCGGSVMPAYRWYFRTKAEHDEHAREAGQTGYVPDHRVLLPSSASEQYGETYVEVWATAEAQDLVAYLLSLKTDRSAKTESSPR
jgi:cytochrome c oxidase cbb3-type subunit II